MTSATLVLVMYYEPSERVAASTENDLKIHWHRCNLQRTEAGLAPLKRDEFEAWHRETPGCWLRAPETRAATQNLIHKDDWTRVRMLLDARQVRYTRINAADTQMHALRNALWDIAGQKTFPLIFLDGACLGGASALSSMVASGDFSSVFSPHLLPAPTALPTHGASGRKESREEGGANQSRGAGGYKTLDTP